MGPSLVALCTVAYGLGVEAGATVESRAGQAPIRAGEPTTPFVAQLLTPVAELRLRYPGLELRWGYAPRIYWESPNPSGQLGPLILHSSALALDARLSTTVTAAVTASVAIGQPDYTLVAPLIGAMQGALPPATTLASASGRAGLRARLSERFRLELPATYQRWQWLDATPAAVTSQTVAAVEPAGILRLTSRQDLGLGVALGGAWYSNGVVFWTVSPRARWGVALSARSELRLMLGLAYGRDAGTVDALGPSGRAVSPIGSFEVAGPVAESGDVTLLLSAGGGVDFYLDPVLGTADPRGSLRAEFSLTLAPAWMAVARGELSTVLRDAPRIDNADETVAAGGAFARRRFSPDFFADLGVQWADRAPALVSPTFAFHQRQTWAYLALSGTTRVLEH